MLDHIRSLYRHQAWADDELLKAVTACEPAQQDSAMLHALHHVVNVQRYLLTRFNAQPYDMGKFKEQPAYAELVGHFHEAHAANEDFVASLTEADLGRPFEMPFFKANFTLLEGMTQCVLHSQNHRGQCLTRLRELGAKPPTLDYILWVKDAHPRPADALTR
jgi:uncharacterized damage-inducible protein DinB